ncbi:MAG: hypothetical protein J6C13_02410 [Clostridia bacterium]|nr:hypothetical protein [Clostridia bacterium]
MYIDEKGKEWSSEKIYFKYKEFLKCNLSRDLALEDYADDTNDEQIYNFEPFKKLNFFRENKATMNEQELLSITEEIFVGFNKLIEEIGKEKFIFYDDGGVEYIWKNLNKSK